MNEEIYTPRWWDPLERSFLDELIDRAWETMWAGIRAGAYVTGGLAAVSVFRAVLKLI